MPRNKPHSEETKKKIGLANKGIWIKHKCDFCNIEREERKSHYDKSKLHFCNLKCRGNYYKQLDFTKQPNYRGIRKNTEAKWIYSSRYRKTHPEIISHLKANRYARQKQALGTHSLDEWKSLCEKFKNKCAICKEEKKLTKDHIKPLSLGGSNNIENIQPLCRNCNSRKWKTYQNKELLN